MSKEKGEKIKSLVFSFDLPFSDMLRNESVRSATFEKKFSELERIRKIKNGDSIVNYVLFMKLEEQHPTARLWLETETDLSSSIYLMLGGYYRQALMCLRTWLELTLIGIYYKNYWKGKSSRYNQWKTGRRQSPAWRQLLDALFSRTEFNVADKTIDLRNRLEILYNELSAFVHNRGMSRYRLQNGRDNVPRYVESAFSIYYQMVQKVFDMQVLMLFISYPNELTYTKEEEFEEIEDLLTTETRKYIESLYTLK
jgi:hypothetical protein